MAPKASVGLFLCLCTTPPALVAGQGFPKHETKSELLTRAETLPDCATSCLVDLAPQYGCDLTDTECTCNNADLTTAAGACIGANCTIRDALTTQRLTAQTCGAPVRNRGPNCRAITWSLFAISIVFVGLRFVARTKRLDGPGFGADDWTMLVVMLFMFPHEIGVELLVRNGLGMDIWMINPLDQLTTLLMVFWQGEMYYSFIVTGTKISILLLYLRIFPKTVASRWFRLIVWILIGICAGYNAAFVLSVIFQCDPVVGAYKAWDGSVEAQCINTNAQIVISAGINIALDLLVFFLPIPRLMKLEISARKKIGVCLTFMVGLFVTVVSIVRLVEFLANYESPNTTWNFVPIVNWSQFEVNVGIWCACMPALARLVKKFWVDILGRKLSSYFSRGEHTNNANSASYIKSRTSHRERVGSGSDADLRGDVEPIPSDSIAKTVEARVVYDRRNDSSDEVELVDKDSMSSASAMYPQHKYVRDW